MLKHTCGAVVGLGTLSQAAVSTSPAVYEEGGERSAQNAAEQDRDAHDLEEFCEDHRHDGASNHEQGLIACQNLKDFFAEGLL
jgi:hypothetical protein